MQTPSKPEESAINEHSCALACLVSLCRDCGVIVAQNDLITQYSSQISKWQASPGLLNLVELIGFLRVLLGVRACIVSDDKAEILQRLRDTDVVGGFVITKMYWDENGNLSDYNHCKRIIGFSGDGIVLMNPKPHGQADTVAWKWDALGLWQAYALIVKR
jgi:hypothetical protein